jgi:energy-coupling factor transporter ATP-binding protein EcfA2
MEMNIIKLKKFDMKTIPDSKRLLIIGNTGSGKSTLALDYLYHHKSELLLFLQKKNLMKLLNHIYHLFLFIINISQN